MCLRIQLSLTVRFAGACAAEIDDAGADALEPDASFDFELLLTLTGTVPMLALLVLPFLPLLHMRGGEAGGAQRVRFTGALPRAQ